MKTPKYVLINDCVRNFGDATISVNDRGYQFGDGVYEVIRFYDRQFFRLEDHIKRLNQSLEKVCIPVRYDLEQIKKELEKLVALEQCTTGYVYLQVSRGVAERNHLYPNQQLDPVFVAYAVEEKRPVEKMENGIRVLLTEDIRWKMCDVKSLNLLGAVLAKNKAAERGLGEAVLYRDDIVTEASSSNVFIVKDKRIYTHPANHLILNGITRMAVLEIAKDLGLEIKEEEFKTKFFLTADEMFVTSTTIEVLPVIGIETENGIKINVQNERPGEITKMIQKEFRKRIRE